MSAEDDFYVPEPVGIADGDVVIHDPTEFFDLTKSIAALNRDGVLFVLDRETHRWRNVEPETKQPNVRPLGSTRQ